MESSPSKKRAVLRRTSWAKSATGVIRYRSAKLLIDQHGEDAPIFAAMQADKCLEGGDLDGKAVWMGVIRAIKELLDQQPTGSGTPLH